MNSDPPPTLLAPDRPAHTHTVLCEAAPQYKVWFEDNPLPMWVFDPKSFSVLEVNEAAVRHYGYTRPEFLSMTILDIRPPEDIPRLLANMNAWYEHRTQKVPSRHRKKDGSLIDVEVYSQQVMWNGRAAEVVQVHDVSEVKRAEEALRNLSGRLLQLQDLQKRAMARELHDAVGQSLTALLARLGVVSRSIEFGGAATRKELDECVRLAAHTLDEVRTVSYLLHPPLLDEEGLGAALEVYVEGFAERSGIEVTVVIPSDLGRLPEELEITLFRVVQEALTNVHRHSESRTAVVRLVSDSECLLLEVQDQGKGIAPEILERVRRHGAIMGVGIAGMRERVAQLGGQLTIDSSEKGSVIRAVFPRAQRG